MGNVVNGMEIIFLTSKKRKSRQWLFYCRHSNLLCCKKSGMKSTFMTKASHSQKRSTKKIICEIFKSLKKIADCSVWWFFSAERCFFEILLLQKMVNDGTCKGNVISSVLQAVVLNSYRFLGLTLESRNWKIIKISLNATNSQKKSRQWVITIIIFP